MRRSSADKIVLAIALFMLASCIGQSKRSEQQDFNLPMESINLIDHSRDRRLGNETGTKVSEWHANMPVNPEELGEYLEGDIMVSDSFRRNGIKAESTRWPDGVVPYMLSLYFDEKQQRVIRDAMADFHRYTCIKFKPYNGEESDYVRLTAGNTGCWSSVGRIGGPQDINLQVPGCLTRKGTVIHELMHVIGFFHEQSRTERDNFIDVQWQNIQPGLEGNFEKYERSTADAFGVLYDYGSVMHYSSSAFSRNGKPTIIPRDKTTATLGQREGLSTKDIQKIRRMYKCNEKKRKMKY